MARQHLIHYILLICVTAIAFSCSLLGPVAAEGAVSVKVYEGPSSSSSGCPSEEEAIQGGNYVRIHFTVSIDETSKTGTPGKEYESTLIEGEPIGVTIGHNEVIPGWEKGLMGLCQGDKAILVVPPELAYGDEGTGTGDEDIPGGATIQFDIHVVSVLEGPPEDEDEDAARAMFANADLDHDGKLSRVEFNAMFVNQLGDMGEDLDEIQKQLDQFWHAQDYDEDGYLTIEEFLGPAEVDDEEEDTDPAEEFALLDTDADGRLSKTEIEAFFASLGQDVPGDFWEHLDENSDGYISFEEFFDADEDEADLEQEL